MLFLSVLMAFVTAWSQASGHIMGTSPCAIEASRLTVDYVPSIATDGMPRLSDRRRPLLGWWLLPAGGTNSTARNLSQSAYRIVVKSDPSGSDDLIYYDSGKVVSNDSVAVPYGGPPVPSRAQVWWRVEVWDQEGASCGLSLELASWEVPLVNLSAWQGAQWLTQEAQPHPKPSSCSFYQNNPAPLFRRAFSLSQEPSNIIRARVYVTGLGYYKLFLNGLRVGNAELDPGVTSYNKTIFYTTSDVTLALRTASNLSEVVLGVSLGNGWYNFIPLRFWGSKNFRDALAHGDPMFRLLLCVDYADTSTQHVISSADGQWRVGGSEILQNSIHLGTVVDRRLEPEGWSTPSFRVPSSWKTPFVVNSDAAGMKASLRSQYVPTVQRVKTILPVEHHRVNSSSAEPTYIVDIGRQIAGICRLAVTCESVRLAFRFANTGCAVRIAVRALLLARRSLRVPLAHCALLLRSQGGAGLLAGARVNVVHASSVVVAVVWPGVQEITLLQALNSQSLSALHCLSIVSRSHVLRHSFEAASNWHSSSAVH